MISGGLYCGHRNRRAIPLRRRMIDLLVTAKETNMMMTRRTLAVALVGGAAASLISTPGVAATATAVTRTKIRNVVLVHGLFADGSCWTDVIARLQRAGLNVTSVQNP